MFARMRRGRPRASPAQTNEVRLHLESLENRESPSSAQPSDLLASPFIGPLGATDTPAVVLVPPNSSVTAPATNALAEVPLVPSDNSLLTVAALASALPVTDCSGNSPSGPNTGDSAPPDNGHRPPEIIDFHAIEGVNGCWSFEGVVKAENTWHLLVRFDGLQTLKGQAVDTKSDGSFELDIKLQTGEHGMATSQATDWDGQDSNVATDWVHQTNGGR
jgi:hypothetical protein